MRGLRFISQFDLDPDPTTLQQMRDEAPSVSLVSGERIGGGLAADGLGELSKLLLGSHPAKALRIARDTGVLVQLLPELEPAIGFEQESRYHALTVDEHTFAVVQAAADARTPLRVRLATLFHDAGKPQVAWRGTDGRLHYYAKRQRHQESRAGECRARRRGAQPASLPDRPAQASRAHRARAHVRPGEGRRAARAETCWRGLGDSLAFDLLDHKAGGPAAAKGNQPRQDELDRLARCSRGGWSRSRGARTACETLRSPATISFALGHKPGPEIGRTLQALLSEVVARPEPEHGASQLLARARELLFVIRWDEPGYVVAFTTRLGRRQRGAPYDSLNLTRGTGDSLERVEENRRIACESLGLTAERLTFNRQVHSPTVHRATPGLRGAPGDGLWTEDADVPLLAMSADCLPIAVARTSRGPRGLAVLHAGWRGALGGDRASRSGGARARPRRL